MKDNLDSMILAVTAQPKGDSHVRLKKNSTTNTVCFTTHTKPDFREGKEMEMRNKINLNKLIESLEAEVELANKSLADFKKKLEINPEYAFRTAGNAMEGAATIRLLARALPYLKSDKSVDTDEQKIQNYKNDLNREVMLMSLSINNHSTSNMENAMEEHSLAVAATFLEKIQRAF